MPASPVFQRLPLHIAERIAHYYIHTIVEDKHYTKEYECETSVWSILYNVSYSWRTLALQFFFQEVTIEILTETGKGQFKYACLPDEIKLDAVHHKYVKRVNIDFPDFAKPPTKTSLQDFSSAWPRYLAFPSAIILYIDMRGLLYQLFDENNSAKSERFYWISQRIKTAMPKLQEVTLNDIGIERMRGKWPYDTKWKAEEFLWVCFDKLTAFDIRLTAANLICDYSLIQNGTGLTRLQCQCSSTNNFISSVIMKSAPTLESLVFDDQTLKNMESLVFDDMRKPVVYPKLQKLELYSLNNATFDVKLQVDKSVVLFPALRFLRWHTLYIFEDDALFRGNEDTLEYLDIQIDLDFVHALRRHEVFSNGRHSRLYYVAVGVLSNSNKVTLSRDVFMMFAVDLIAPNTKYLFLGGYYLFNDNIRVVSASPYFGNLQILNLANAQFTLHELLELVKLLPNMTKLRCAPRDIDTKLDTPQFSEFINKLYSEFYPLSHCFRYWIAPLDLHYQHDYLAPCALVFAILCPNFVLATTPPAFRNEYGRKIQDAIDCGLYVDHIDKIQRLLRIMG
ncbi:hypothetical protein IW140_000629 [Coemansia sp. RSA 1813]|nr:hypothetical protein EV178_003333 [Coemansia sp. RSA 1646]KAJ2572866.1 hypothetical protein IW140_000629 [Coemansia sp. RSA 1813]